MALLIAQALRDSAREAVLACGARGFVRFGAAGGALLMTDALRRCADGPERLTGALEARGFCCCAQDGLLMIVPSDALIAGACAADAPPVRWDSPLHPAQALARRWLGAPPVLLTPAGWRLAVETLRLTGMPGADVCAGLSALRAQAAVMLRAGDRCGMHESGAVLAQWCACQAKEGTE